MYRQIITPTEKDHSIELPPKFYGKRVEILAFEINQEMEQPVRTGKKNIFLNDVEAIPDFPSIEEIRKEAWPNKW